MKVDLNAKIRAIDGKVFRQFAADGKTLVDWDCDLKELVFASLKAQFQSDFGLSVPDKMKIYRLAKRVYEADGQISLESEEVTLIKERARQAYGNEQFGAMVDLLEGTNEIAQTLSFRRNSADTAAAP